MDTRVQSSRAASLFGPTVHDTSERVMLREQVHRFVARDVEPHADAWERVGFVPREVIRRLGELGWLGLQVPEAYGGSDADSVTNFVFAETLSRSTYGGFVVTVLVHTDMASPHLVRAGTDAQKSRWLPGIVRGDIVTAIAVTEPDAGSDVARMKTTAVRKGDEYVLNGSKTFITNAGYANWTVVFAKTDPSKGHKGISAFVVPMDTPGVTIEEHLDKMGQRATDTSAFALQDVVVPAENRLGEEGQGFKIAMQTLDFTRPGTAIGAVGVAQAAYEYAVEYAKERVTFDMPIAMHQGVNFLIADMATEIHAARLLTWQAAWMLDQGERATLYSSFAKRFAADTAMKVTTDAVQIFGGYGYMKEYPVEKLMRDAKLFQIYEGTSQIQRLVIAKEIFLPRG
jgi:acyl-CoA dehydrogenase